MILYAEALDKIEAVALKRMTRFLQTEEALLFPEDAAKAVGRILAENAICNEFIPAFHNSSMDGFAVRSEQVRDASPAHPMSLRVKGCIFAGDPVPNANEFNDVDAVEIMTGAAVPPGFDSIIKIEEVRVIEENGKTVSIQLKSPTQKGDFIRPKGADYRPEQIVAKTGSRLSPEHILGFATTGIAEVEVQRPPRIAILSTGNELESSMSAVLSSGKIRNSTAPYLMSAIPLFGAAAKFYGTVSDDAESFKKIFRQILKDSPDVILTTGAVSKGKLDFVPAALLELGAKTHFHGVAIRPGRPLLFAEFKDGPALFSVPGNPISTAVALRFLISPYLDALRGMKREKPSSAILLETTAKAQGLRCFWKSVVHTDAEGARVRSQSGQESFRVSSLVGSSAWMMLPEEPQNVAGGETVEIYPLYPKLGLEDVHSGDCC